MINLILKDIRTLGFLNIILLCFPLGLGFIGTRVGNTALATIIYSLATFLTSYILSIRISINDTNSNADPLLVSLPIKRFDIVKARYLSIFLYSLMISALIFLSSKISNAVGGVLISSGNGTTFSLVSIAFTLSIVFTLSSINIPLQYSNPRKTQVFNALLYAFIFLFPNIYDRLGLNFLNPELLDKILSLNLELIAGISLLGSLLAYTLSSFVSKAIFERKEF